MIEVKFGRGDHFDRADRIHRTNEPLLTWGMMDEWAHKLAEAFQSATNGQDITLSTPMGLFEFKHIEKEDDE